ncbi:AAA family ATPase [Paracoccaceae bacterium Fryx2]|nr:AAA family ATPase [Paracoccaceae bacterium Fryx2]
MTPMTAPTAIDPDLATLERLRAALQATRASVATMVIGQPQALDLMLIGLIAGGHVLLEGPPGVGKTLMVRCLAQVSGLSFSRIQFTPDLMPADIVGAMVMVPDADGRNRLEFRKGPVFAQLLLADEINRASPRTQSALLEAMQEATISSAGISTPLPRPFFVLATQNPIEMEGTYSLPEAQIDRFLFRIDVADPDQDTLTDILTATTGAAAANRTRTITPDDILQLQALVRSVPIAEPLRRGVARLSVATQPGRSDTDATVTRHVRFGISPRGAQALVLGGKAHALLAGRNHVAVADLRAVLLPVVRHRLQLNFEGLASNLDADALMLRLFDQCLGHL